LPHKIFQASWGKFGQKYFAPQRFAASTTYGTLAGLTSQSFCFAV